jgi:DnaJ-domain-containing protein 1
MSSLAERIAAAARQRLNRLQDAVVDFERRGGVTGAAERVGRFLDDQEARLTSGQSVLHPEHYRQLRVWYARLEVPNGSDVAVIRQAYRKLMRLYHPDVHSHDPESERLATRISQDLTVAYEGLLRHLGEKTSPAAPTR